jgi:hypothetical protein
MSPFIDYSQLLERIGRSFADDQASSKSVRMIGSAFARPNSPFAKSNLIPQLPDFHSLSGKHINFYFAGFEFYHPTLGGMIEVNVDSGLPWTYSPRDFSKCKVELEEMTRWKYSGGSDLLLINATYNAERRTTVIDFSTAVVCQLEKMVGDGAISSVETFFQSIFNFAETSDGIDPAWGFSDKQGLKLTKNILSRVLLSFLPKNIGDDVSKLAHFGVIDVSA